MSAKWLVFNVGIEMKKESMHPTIIDKVKSRSIKDLSKEVKIGRKSARNSRVLRRGVI